MYSQIMTNAKDIKCPRCGYAMATSQEAEAARTKANCNEIVRITAEAIERLRRVREEAGKISRGGGITDA